ncbi:hypothetical protein GOP47_0015894 [Adiantum capillus-veneris]|uniref:Uncharacterized protein n=1 Tax=Adiantum capillus-veneris TaxID=13818 RepID=A0A9D4ZBM4_ADICA|nr:hypothetical protein GOP47_0015894 [Adiantum capillus-veneris]
MMLANGETKQWNEKSVFAVELVDHAATWEMEHKSGDIFQQKDKKRLAGLEENSLPKEGDGFYRGGKAIIQEFQTPKPAPSSPPST